MRNQELRQEREQDTPSSIINDTGLSVLHDTEDPIAELVYALKSIAPSNSAQYRLRPRTAGPPTRYLDMRQAYTIRTAGPRRCSWALASAEETIL